MILRVLGAIFLLLFSGCSIPEGGLALIGNHEDLQDSCINVGGNYAVIGRSLPGMPNYYIVSSIKPTLDAMMGFDVSRARVELSRAKIVQDGKSLKFIFLTDNGTVIERISDRSNGLINCNQKQISIRNTMQTAGEAVSGAVVITRTLGLSEDGSLLVRVLMEHRNRSAIFFWTNREEYAVKYARILIGVRGDVKG